MSKKLVTDRELHDFFPQLSLWTIGQLRRQGKIPHIKLPGMRKFLFEVGAIEKWLSDLESESIKGAAK
ncbi:MAG TPA: hypothetical protein VN370_13415 [Desulfitobacteriaceae bacterium]|nr:hypothetical protein [Desulfitobacteriaceae bacterium]